ncbi:unnamed protein product [Blepharisma stoltei]|uniref:Uncharacterized protein n=1 Tax=Blepharisma stoltei TaxID=1481888 RepID=A0AAU9IB76_9CILI|nr:unnamed protein product [Blepharisma stoltei]
MSSAVNLLISNYIDETFQTRSKELKKKENKRISESGKKDLRGRVEKPRRSSETKGREYLPSHENLNQLENLWIWGPASAGKSCWVKERHGHVYSKMVNTINICFLWKVQIKK